MPHKSAPRDLSEPVAARGGGRRVRTVINQSKFMSIFETLEGVGDQVVRVLLGFCRIFPLLRVLTTRGLL